MTRPVVVALVSSSPGWRGSVVSFAKVAEGLKAAGHRALFVTVHPAVTARLEGEGHVVEQLGAQRTGLRELRGMRAILRRHGVTALYADMPRDLRLAALAGWSVGAATAFRFNVNAGKMKGDLLTRLAARATGAVVVLSEWSRVRRTRSTTLARHTSSTTTERSAVIRSSSVADWYPMAIRQVRS